MYRLLQYYVWKAVWPMVAILTVSLVVLLLVLWGVSVVEDRAGRPTVFQVELRPLGDAPLWVLLTAGMFVVNGITMARWALMTADVARRRVGYGYEVNVPFPTGKMTAINILYVGGAVLAFYVVRAAVW